MAEENTDSMNLDLNLGPNNNSNDSSEFGSGSYSSVALNMGNWLDRQGNRWVGPRVIRLNGSSLSWRRDQNLFEMGYPATGLTSRGAPQTGPNSVVSEIRPVEISKISEKRSGFSSNDETRDKKEGGKNYNDESGFFDCNICLDLAREPVVTCCGHLFCWPCIYRWLHHHSSAKECPVCKGRITVKNIIPIYGPGPSTLESDVDLHMKIPPRPKARRVERLSQLIQRIRRVGNSSDFGSRIVPIHFQNYAPITDLTNPISSSERVGTDIRSFLQIDRMESNQEPAPPFEDRDSVSSIAAVIHSGGQMADNAVEIDSTVSLSTSSSRRRTGASRNSDVDNGDSRITRRRLY